MKTVEVKTIFGVHYLSKDKKKLVRNQKAAIQRKTESSLNSIIEELKLSYRFRGTQPSFRVIEVQKMQSIYIQSKLKLF